MKVTIVVTKQTQTGIAIMPKNKFHMSSASVRSIAQFASQTPKARKKREMRPGVVHRSRSSQNLLFGTHIFIVGLKFFSTQKTHHKNQRQFRRVFIGEQSPGLRARCSTTSSFLSRWFDCHAGSTDVKNRCTFTEI
jgi:hypothetical protein